MNRGFATEYQAMLNDLSEYRAAYQQAKNNLARATEPPRVSRNNRRDASPEKRTETENIPDKANISDKPIKTISAELGKSIRSNIFFGMVPKKTMAFEKFTRIHRLELEAIGDPAQRHLALSKRLKLDYAAQSGSVLKTADAAMEDLRAMYFKRIIGMRDAFVSGYASSGGADAPSVSTKHVSTLNKQACDDWS